MPGKEAGGKARGCAGVPAPAGGSCQSLAARLGRGMLTGASAWRNFQAVQAASFATLTLHFCPVRAQCAEAIAESRLSVRSTTVLDTASRTRSPLKRQSRFARSLPRVVTAGIVIGNAFQQQRADRQPPTASQRHRSERWPVGAFQPLTGGARCRSPVTGVGEGEAVIKPQSRRKGAYGPQS